MTMDIAQRLRTILEEFTRDLASFRLGRATPALVEHILVDYYGTPTPLKQLATITAPEAKMLMVSPFDMNAAKNIETALAASDLGAQPVNDGRTIRLVLPPLTDERRQQLIKSLNVRTEEARVRVRQVREETMKDITTRERDGQLSEDDAEREKKATQAAIDASTADIGRLADEKIADVAHV